VRGERIKFFIIVIIRNATCFPMHWELKPPIWYVLLVLFVDLHP